MGVIDDGPHRAPFQNGFYDTAAGAVIGRANPATDA
jgi:hypothetical protein